MPLDHDSPENLDAQLVALHDLVVDRDGVADPEIRQIAPERGALERFNLGL
jgi:hypothetical protein